MPTARWKQIVRQFPENGMKLLLEEPANVRDLLALAQTDVLPLLDLDRLQLVRTTFVARDFRHIEADVVLTAPLRVPASPRRHTVWIYLLIEHQSEPDLLMPIRLLDYIVQIIKAQLRAWTNTHASFAGFRVQPIIPLVFYTGSQRWRNPGRLFELVEFGERFRSLVPDFEPLFVSLEALAPEQLVSEGGALGQVLRLVRERKARPEEFRRLLEAAVANLETMPQGQRLRWLELLSYIHMLVYHERTGAQRLALQKAIESSVQSDVHRREVQTMQRTFAQEMEEKGRRKGLRQGEIRVRQKTLLGQLRLRFGDVPETLVAAVNACADVQQLDAWLGNFATARTLADVGIN